MARSVVIIWPFVSRLQFKSVDYAAAAGFIAYSASAMITPICLVVIARELGFSLTGGGALEVARSLPIVLTLLLSGFLAGRFGKVLSIGGSLLVVGAGLMLYAIAPTYGVIVIAAGLMGAGGGVVEGLLNPLVQEAHPTDPGRYLNIVNAFWSIGVLLTALVGGELLSIGVPWRAILASLGAFTLVVGASFVLLHRAAPQYDAVHSKQVLGHKLAILRAPRFWLFATIIALAGAVEGAFTFWSASFVQLNYRDDPRAAGIAAACFAGGMIIGRFLFGALVSQHHLHRLILLSAIAGMLVSAVVPIVGNLSLLYAVLLLAGLSVACFWPSIQSYAADRMNVDTTALFILLSCGGIPGFAGASWIMGLLGDHYNLTTSFTVVPALFAALVALIIWEGARE